MEGNQLAQHDRPLQTANHQTVRLIQNGSRRAKPVPSGASAWTRSAEHSNLSGQQRKGISTNIYHEKGCPSRSPTSRPISYLPYETPRLCDPAVLPSARLALFRAQQSRKEADSSLPRVAETKKREGVKKNDHTGSEIIEPNKKMLEM